MTQLKQALFLPEPKNHPKFDTFQDLKAPKHLRVYWFFWFLM